jgi:hypothetical protein
MMTLEKCVKSKKKWGFPFATVGISLCDGRENPSLLIRIVCFFADSFLQKPFKQIQVIVSIN